MYLTFPLSKLVCDPHIHTQNWSVIPLRTICHVCHDKYMEKYISYFYEFLLCRSSINHLVSELKLVVDPLGKFEHHTDLPIQQHNSKNGRLVSFSKYICVRMLITLPVTTCECKRSFSSLRHIKTWTRSKSKTTVWTELAYNIYTGKRTYQSMKLLIGFLNSCVYNCSLGYLKIFETNHLFSGHDCLIRQGCH